MCAIAFSLFFIGCPKDLKTVGTVDISKLITQKDLAEMGYEKAVDSLLGEIVTVSGLKHISVTGDVGMVKERNMCDQYFYMADEYNKNFRPVKISGYTTAISGLFNLNSNQIKGIFSHSKNVSTSMDVEEPTFFKQDVCDPGPNNPEPYKNTPEFTRETNTNIINSPDLIVTGKIVEIHGKPGKNITLSIRAIGISY